MKIKFLVWFSTKVLQLAYLFRWISSLANHICQQSSSFNCVAFYANISIKCSDVVVHLCNDVSWLHRLINQLMDVEED